MQKDTTCLPVASACIASVFDPFRGAATTDVEIDNAMHMIHMQGSRSSRDYVTAKHSSLYIR